MYTFVSFLIKCFVYITVFRYEALSTFSFLGNISDTTILKTSISAIIINDIPVPISICQNVCSNIFTPINVSSTPKPYFKVQNIFITLLSIKNNERNPNIAKILEKNTINGSCVTENTAGIESTANITSENSITNSTTNSGVIYLFPSTRAKKSWP